MKIDLSRLLDRTVYKVDFDQTLELERITTNEREIRLITPIRVNGSVSKTDDGMYLDADIIYEYSENCARCLKVFKKKIQTVLSGRLMEKSKSSTKEDDSEVIICFYGDNVEVEEHIITAILLSLPMKVVCKDDCKGLCPKCGKDLNEGQCDCIIEDIDPRLATLKDLFD